MAAVRALKQAVSLLTGAAGSSDTTAVTHGALSDSVVRTIVGTVKPDITDLKAAITEANAARALAIRQLNEALAEYATNGNAADGSLQGQITALSGTVGDNSASIVEEAVARATADYALSGRVDVMTAAVNSNNAAIIDEQVVRSAQNDSIAAQVTTLTSTANRAVSYYQPSAPTASGLKVGDLWVDTSQGNALKRWSGTAWVLAGDNAIAQNTAAITNEQTARTTAISAIALQQATLSTTVGQNTSSIQTQAASLNGVLSQYTITGSINGYTGKFSFGGVKKADGTVAFGAEIDGGLVVNGTISGTKIGAQQVTADKIQTGAITSASGVIGALSVKSLSIGDNAVTVPIVAYRGDTIYGSSSYQNVVELYLYIDTTGLAGKPISIYAICNAAQFYPAITSQLYYMQLSINGSAVQYVGGESVDTNVTVAGAATVYGNGGLLVVGVTGYWWGAAGNLALSGRTLFAVACLR